MRVLRLLFLVVAVINASLAQCPWHKDVPDLQTACLCAYNLGHELSVQCDQVRRKITNYSSHDLHLNPIQWNVYSPLVFSLFILHFHLDI